jgi:hypothetical protein
VVHGVAFTRRSPIAPSHDWHDVDNYRMFTDDIYPGHLSSDRSVSRTTALFQIESRIPRCFVYLDYLDSLSSSLLCCSIPSPGDMLHSFQGLCISGLCFSGNHSQPLRHERQERLTEWTFHDFWIDCQIPRSSFRGHGVRLVD